MNVITQIATQFLINKNTLLQLLKTLNFSNDFLNEFRQDRICINENVIKRQIQILCDINDDDAFKDLFCHEDGVQFVFHIHFHWCRFICFRVSFDIKLIAVLFNNDYQKIQFMINNIQIQSLNRFSKLFRLCVQSRTRSLVVQELERIFSAQHIPYERLFNDIKRPLIYQVNLSNIKEFDRLRERYLFIGNRSILDLIEITYVEHCEKTIVLGFRLNTTLNEQKTIQFTDC